MFTSIFLRAIKGIINAYLPSPACRGVNLITNPITSNFMHKKIRRRMRKAWWLVKYFGFNTLLSIFTHEPHEPIVIKCNGGRVNATPYLLRWLLHVIDVDFVRDIHCRDGEFIVINARGNEVRIKYDGGYYVINGYRFKIIRGTFADTFLSEDYHDANIRNKVIIDVGAFVGDSAIYFAFRGARKVIAIEPHPGAYAEMLDNIRLNNMESVIIPINAGLASKPGKVCVEDVDITKWHHYRPSDCPNTVPAITLGELISRFGVDPNDAVLKMDCEGCEFDVILSDYEHVRLFRELILEYHPRFANKSLDDLLNALGRDYSCNIKGNKDLGIMHCVRK